jgi:Uma2 family endonuclease
MAEPQRKPWTWDSYLDWEGKQPIRYELVDGQVYAMGGGTLAHDVIANNLRREMAVQLRGGQCRACGPDVKVATGTGNARYTDALIDCGRSREPKTETPRRSRRRPTRSHPELASPAAPKPDTRSE